MSELGVEARLQQILLKLAGGGGGATSQRLNGNPIDLVLSYTGQSDFTTRPAEYFGPGNILFQFNPKNTTWTNLYDLSLKEVGITTADLTRIQFTTLDGVAGYGVTDFTSASPVPMTHMKYTGWYAPQLSITSSGFPKSSPKPWARSRFVETLIISRTLTSWSSDFNDTASGYPTSGDAPSFVQRLMGVPRNFQIPELTPLATYVNLVNSNFGSLVDVTAPSPIANVVAVSDWNSYSGTKDAKIIQWLIAANRIFVGHENDPLIGTVSSESYSVDLIVNTNYGRGIGGRLGANRSTILGGNPSYKELYRGYIVKIDSVATAAFYYGWPGVRIHKDLFDGNPTRYQYEIDSTGFGGTNANAVAANIPVNASFGGHAWRAFQDSMNLTINVSSITNAYDYKTWLVGNTLSPQGSTTQPIVTGPQLTISFTNRMQVLEVTEEDIFGLFTASSGTFSSGNWTNTLLNAQIFPGRPISFGTQYPASYTSLAADTGSINFAKGGTAGVEEIVSNTAQTVTPQAFLSYGIGGDPTVSNPSIADTLCNNGLTNTLLGSTAFKFGGNGSTWKAIVANDATYATYLTDPFFGNSGYLSGQTNGSYLSSALGISGAYTYKKLVNNINVDGYYRYSSGSTTRQLTNLPEYYDRKLEYRNSTYYTEDNEIKLQAFYFNEKPNALHLTPGAGQVTNNTNAAPYNSVRLYDYNSAGNSERLAGIPLIYPDLDSTPNNVYHLVDSPATSTISNTNVNDSPDASSDTGGSAPDAIFAQSMSVTGSVTLSTSAIKHDDSGTKFDIMQPTVYVVNMKNVDNLANRKTDPDNATAIYKKVKLDLPELETNLAVKIITKATGVAASWYFRVPTITMLATEIVASPAVQHRGYFMLEHNNVGYFFVANLGSDLTSPGEGITATLFDLIDDLARPEEQDFEDFFGAGIAATLVADPLPTGAYFMPFCVNATGTLPSISEWKMSTYDPKRRVFYCPVTTSVGSNCAYTVVGIQNLVKKIDTFKTPMVESSASPMEAVVEHDTNEISEKLLCHFKVTSNNTTINRASIGVFSLTVNGGEYRPN